MLSYQEFKTKYDFNVPILKNNALKCIINKYSKLFKRKENSKCLSYPYIPKNLELFVHNKKGIKVIYKIFNANTAEPINKQKVMKLFDITIDEINQIYKLPFILTKNSKLQWFQYKINHLVLTTNAFLSKINLIQNPLCTFCETEHETIIHLLWECQKVQALLDNIDNWLQQEVNVTLNFKKKGFILGIVNNKYSKVKKLNNFDTQV